MNHSPSSSLLTLVHPLTYLKTHSLHIMWPCCHFLIIQCCDLALCFQAMLSLLGKFDLCYEVPRLEGKYLPDGRHFKFPYLVPEKMPEQAMYIWTESVPENFEEHQLMLSLEAPTIPQSFMEKISIRINPFLDLRADWKWGTVAFCNEGQDVIKVSINDE